MIKQKGVFVVSLDFELYWGVRDKRTLGSYKENILGVRSVVPALLRLFEEYGIHATWAVVGFLFFETRDELIKGLPSRKPGYLNAGLSPYSHIDSIGADEKEDPFHYAPSLIKMIASHAPSQEIGSHTFSHYYCLEKGQDIDTFRDDLDAAVRAAKKYNLNITSLVFPRNQFNRDYISICREMGIRAYRGNEAFWIYEAKNEENKPLFRKALRLMDAYINISGHNCYPVDRVVSEFPCNIPSSRFLRPYSDSLKILEPLRLKRILSGIAHAAKRGEVYHLWWHPHNFGINMDKNIMFLKKILDHYLKMKKLYGIESLNMRELSDKVIREINHGR
ncbi:MAG: polysaccharide deacetylase family protein [Candidatus Omnitrophota bacterium]|nr:polysaccharide deacetylase family protein [Candidatus Omnitrophota bacterium]